MVGEDIAIQPARQAVARASGTIGTLGAVARRNKHVGAVDHDRELHVRPRLFHRDLGDFFRQGFYRHTVGGGKLRGLVDGEPVMTTIAVLPLTICEHARREHSRHGFQPLGITRLLRSPLLKPRHLVGGVAVHDHGVGAAHLHREVGPRMILGVGVLDSAQAALFVPGKILALRQLRGVYELLVLLGSLARRLALVSCQFIDISKGLGAQLGQLSDTVFCQRGLSLAGAFAPPLGHVAAVAQEVALGQLCLDNLVAGLNQLVESSGVVAGEVEPAHLLRQVAIRVVAA